jgi:hypothetical protein
MVLLKYRVDMSKKEKLEAESAETPGMFLWMILRLWFASMDVLRWAVSTLKPELGMLP